MSTESSKETLLTPILAVRCLVAAIPRIRGGTRVSWEDEVSFKILYSASWPAPQTPPPPTPGISFGSSPEFIPKLLPWSCSGGKTAGGPRTQIIKTGSNITRNPSAAVKTVCLMSQLAPTYECMQGRSFAANMWRVWIIFTRRVL